MENRAGNGPVFIAVLKTLQPSLQPHPKKNTLSTCQSGQQSSVLATAANQPVGGEAANPQSASEFSLPVRCRAGTHITEYDESRLGEQWKDKLIQNRSPKTVWQQRCRHLSLMRQSLHRQRNGQQEKWSDLPFMRTIAVTVQVVDALASSEGTGAALR